MNVKKFLSLQIACKAVIQSLLPKPSCDFAKSNLWFIVMKTCAHHLMYDYYTRQTIVVKECCDEQNWIAYNNAIGYYYNGQSNC